MKWNRDTILQAAMDGGFKTRVGWYRGDQASYDAAWRRGLIDYVADTLGFVRGTPHADMIYVFRLFNPRRFSLARHQSWYKIGITNSHINNRRIEATATACDAVPTDIQMFALRGRQYLSGEQNEYWIKGMERRLLSATKEYAVPTSIYDGPGHTEIRRLTPALHRLVIFSLEESLERFNPCQ